MAEQAEMKKKRTPSAQKRQLQSEKKRLANKGYRSQVRTATRKLHESLQQNKPEEAQTLYRELSSMVDKAVNKGIFKKNKANRIKSRFAARFQ